MTDQQTITSLQKQIERLEGELREIRDISLARLQFPDGTVPGSTVECAIGWHHWANKYWEERDSLKSQLAAAKEELNLLGDSCQQIEKRSIERGVELAKLRIALAAAEAKGEALREVLATAKLFLPKSGTTHPAPFGFRYDEIHDEAHKALSTPPSTFLREYLELVGEAQIAVQMVIARDEHALKELGDVGKMVDWSSTNMLKEALERLTKFLSTLTPRNEETK